MSVLKTLNENGKLSHISNRAMPISEYQDYPISILHLSGSMAGMTKDDAVTLNYIYGERSGTCTLKWQGSSSIQCPKKNYTIKFDNEFEVVSGWGSQKKYVLKANFVDSSHARNIVCAKLWGQIVKSRTPANATLNALPNGGAVDGFPIVVAFNGEFHGLYTWNIPKDDWMFGMDGTGQQAILCAETANNGAVNFKGLATLTEDANGELDFDVEYSSDDKTDWILTSLNRLISAVKDSDGTNITYGITPYIDWESAIDYYIHTVLTANYDGVQRNYLLSTYDGIKWFFTGYDMDVVLGLRAMGKYFYAANNTAASFGVIANTNKLFYLIWKYMRPQLRARYEELRASVMSVENVANMFVDFIADIPSPVYADDVRLYTSIPSTGANNLAQIITYYDLRCRNADEWIKNTSGQTALPEQVNPSIYTVTNSLTNCSTSNSADTVAKDAAYTATITAASGYELGSVTVTMGGVDITSTAYANGVITIPTVTGNIVITATATAIVVSGYVNQVPLSVDENGNVFNGKGWIGATRLSSSGSTKANDYCSATGYISVKGGDVVRLKGVPFTSGSEYVCVYNAEHVLIGYLSGSSHSTAVGTAVVNGDLVTVTLANNSNIAWIRASLQYEGDETNGVDNPKEGPGPIMIVTVNQEITD